MSTGDKKAPSTDARLDDGSYTLVIPTYSRPALLGRLLNYLVSSGLEAPVTILDSSPKEEADQNAEVIGTVDLNITHLRFDPSIHPYEKVRAGLTALDTEFFSMIADDDLVVVPTLRKLLAFMKANPDHAAAHGMYVNFREFDEYFQISYIEQRDIEVTDETPLERFNYAMSYYNVTFYALQRREMAIKAFAPVDRFNTTLCGELATGLLTAIQGKVKRLDAFYIGRNTDESLGYSGWHPHQLLADSPQKLFKDYKNFRAVILETLRETDRDLHKDAEDIVDLIGLRYISPFLKQEHLEFMICEKLFGDRDSRTVYTNFWNKYVRPQRPEIEQTMLFHDDGNTFFPGVQHITDPPRDYVISRDTMHGERRYLIHNEFFFPDIVQKLCTLSRHQTEFMLSEFDHY